ncbi:hypothetical protein [Rickettsia australis]|uniref:hypothetical protein n=1 Tax=Rickettsia australis TaxID=787 RepID=UPI0002FAFDD4|nr:hypothetical protein [Rickettsia australis]
MITFNSPTPITSSGDIGNSSSDVTLTGIVDVYTVSFTTGQPVTLTLTNTSTVGGATTTGNKIHILAITGDLITGTSPFGSDSNHLKTIQLNSDGKFTIDSQDVYSIVTTNTNNEVTAVFNADNGFIDDLGGDNLNLTLVQFSSNKGTVKGDIMLKLLLLMPVNQLYLPVITVRA